MRKGEYRFKIAYKILIFTILVSSIPMTFLSFVFYKRMEQTIKDEMVASYDHISQQYVGKIEYKLGLYDNIMGEVSSSMPVQDFLSILCKDNDPSEVSEVRATILQDINKYLSDKGIEGLNGITLYPWGNKLVLYHGHIGNAENLDNYRWIKSIVEGSEDNNFYSYDDWGYRRVISFYNVIKDSKKFAPTSDTLGIIRLDTFAFNLFELSVDTSTKGDIKVIILDGKGNTLYTIGDGEFWNKRGRFVLESVNQDEEYMETDDEGYLIINREISKYGWTAILLFDYSTINKKIHEGTVSILIINLVIYGILFIVCIAFAYSMSARLKILTDKMDKVKSGTLTTLPVIKGRDEIAEIDNDFNDMVIKLSDLINENYIQSIERKEAELKALRFQINPHFLYNTLELINSMASVYNCDEIGDISQRLGQMFRYNMTDLDSDFTILREEIEHIENYYAIERVRFENKVRVRIDIPEEHLERKIPRFILQPLVENAFRYGFSNEKLEGTIRISANTMGENLYIVVEDDGEGMDETRLHYVKSQLKDDKVYLDEYGDDSKGRGGIGLYNVNARIRLCCGDEYGLRIESQKGIGTKIILLTPKNI